MRITKKQRLTLEVICQGLRDEENNRIGWLDVQLICDRVPYEVSMHSMKFTVRFLAQKGLVTKGDAVLRRERWVVPIIPTDAAYDEVRRRVEPRVIEHDNGVIEELY